MQYLIYLIRQSLVRRSWSARYLRRQLAISSMQAPANIDAMMAGEPEQYSAAAILAVNTRGE